MAGAGARVVLRVLPRAAPIAAVAEALVRAGAEDLPSSLADGLDTMLGRTSVDGAELSGGQWQKLALARGLARTSRTHDEPLLVLLDEPTANLDATTEHALFERYAAAARRAASTTGAITVLVSHRFSTVRMADRIVVLEDGRVAEQGTHSELVALGGRYAELYAIQARAYR